jgi:hypothetical protein
MPDTLYGEGAGLLEGAAKTATDMNQQNLEQQRITTEAGAQAGTQVGETQREQSRQQALLKLKQLESQTKTMTVSPQLAVGLTKYLGPGALQLVGQQDPHFVVGLMHASMSLTLQKLKAPKEFNARVGDKTVPFVQHWNEDTQSWDIQQIGEGGATFSPTARGEVTPKVKYDTTHPKPGKAGSDDQLKKDKLWLGEYDKRKKWLTSDEGRMTQRKDPDQFSRESAWVEDNSPKADDIMQALESSGDEDGTPGGAASDPGITDKDWNAIFSGTQ